MRCVGARCADDVTRFVCSGDNRLWELKAAGGNTANLEAESSTGVLYGAVSYFHAGGIDRPLLISKSGVQIVPHQNWRGVFSAGTYGSGSLVGKKSDCLVFPPQNCTPVDWPGVHTTAWHQRTTGEIRNWFGSLATGMRDASGQTYMRNRYYDPATGQFTQPDPIGLAGGLNSCGFAAGDPVSYWDPMGLCAASQVDHDTMSCEGGLTHGEYYANEDEQQQPGRPARRGARHSTRSSSIPGGTLRAHEGPDRGHTIAVHVNVTQRGILWRAGRTGNPASRFWNLREANEAIELALRANRGRIEQWLAPGNYSPRESFRYTAHRAYGEVAFPNGSIQRGAKIHVVLVRDRYNLDYHILTGYLSP